jgi:hypothetical protein
MRSPLQGGLPPIDRVDGAVVEIACDESGFTGTNLLDPASPIITHASVDLTVDEAVELVATLRSGFQFSTYEFKSGHFLRSPGATEALEWCLARMRGRAYVHLINKEFFLVTRIVDLLLAEPSYAAGTHLTQAQRPAARTLYRTGRAYGRDWQAFLSAFVELFRVKRRRHPDPVVVQRFFQARDELRPAVELLGALDRDRVEGVLTRLFDDDPSIPPPLEPMLPALAETVLFWSGEQRRRVLVTHDEQSALTAVRLRRLQAALADGDGATPLAGLTMADSRDDPRIQVADLLAGVALRLPDSDFVSPNSLRDPPRAGCVGGDG